MSVKVSGLTVRRDFSTERDLVATWGFYYSGLAPQPDGSMATVNMDSGVYVSGWSVRWFWKNQLGITFLGSEKTLSYISKNDTYTMPDSATLVWCVVKPESNDYEVKHVSYDENGNKNEITETCLYFYGDWCDQASYTNTVDLPGQLSSPSIKIDDNVITCELNNITINNNIEETKCRVVWQISQDNKGSDGSYYKELKSKIYNRRSAIEQHVALGHEYRIRCRLQQPYGNSYRFGEWSDWTDNVKTKPSKKPKIKTCRSDTLDDGSCNITLSWTSVSFADNYDVEYTTDVRYFQNGVNPSSGITQVSDLDETNYTLVGVDKGYTYYFRVRAKNDTDYSSWSDYKRVTVGAKPDVPTTWTSTTTAKVGDKVTLYWLHNSEDGSRERMAKVYIEVDGKSQTYDVVKTYTIEDDGENTVSSYEIDTSTYTGLKNGGYLTWKVKTKGISKDWSDWSVTRSVNVYKKPTISAGAIISNDPVTGDKEILADTIYDLPFYLRIKTSPKNQNPISCYIEIKSLSTYTTMNDVAEEQDVSKGDIIFKETFSIPILNSGTSDKDSDAGHIVENNDDIYTIRQWFRASNIDLQDRAKYKFTAKVYFDSGLYASWSEFYKVNWMYDNPECHVNAEITYVESSYSTFVTLQCLDNNSQPAKDYLVSLFRKNYDGTFTLLAKDMNSANLSTVEDLYPSLDYARYRVVVTSKLTGRTFYEDPPAMPIKCPAVVIRWDEKYTRYDTSVYAGEQWRSWYDQTVLALPYNVDISDSVSKDVELIKYIGRQDPVSYYGTQVESSGSWSIDISKADKETLFTIRRLARYMGDVYVREPSGVGYWASVSISYSVNHGEMKIPVSIEVKRVEGGN